MLVESVNPHVPLYFSAVHMATAKRSAERPAAAMTVHRTVIHYRGDASLTFDSLSPPQDDNAFGCFDCGASNRQIGI